MKKILSWLLFFSFVAIVLVNCKNDPANNASPREVVHDFFEKLSRKNLDSAALFATTASKMTFDMFKAKIKEAENEGKIDLDKMDFTEDFKDVAIGESRIDGEEAMVPVSYKKDGTVTIDVKVNKENGAWKVDWSPLRIMEMMHDARERLISDSTRYADSLNVNLDSVSSARLHELKDSIRKHLDPEDMKKHKLKLK